MSETIIVASTDDDYAAFATLVTEYVRWLQTRYADLPGFITTVTDHQGLDEELAALRTRYGPPHGTTLLAVRTGEVVGCGAYRELGDEACEMKRLFVPERHQGQGSGRRLCAALIEHAARAGYRRMGLDTGNLNTEAMALYASLGFRDCPPFHDYPATVKPHLRFMQRPLGATAT